MNSSKLSLLKNWVTSFRGLASIVVVLALLGFSDAVFLTVEHFQGIIPPCSLIEGCEKVLTSSYATVGPVPTALMGSIYYLVVFFLALLSITRSDVRYLYAASILTGAGLVASLYFVFLQIFVIKAICLYCMVSATISALLFALGVGVFYKRRVVTSEAID